MTKRSPGPWETYAGTHDEEKTGLHLNLASPEGHIASFEFAADCKAAAKLPELEAALLQTNVVLQACMAKLPQSLVLTEVQVVYARNKKLLEK